MVALNCAGSGAIAFKLLSSLQEAGAQCHLAHEQSEGIAAAQRVGSKKGRLFGLGKA
jgi:hypothetical protein